MAALKGRDLPNTNNPLRRKATGEWFRRRGTRIVVQRYDEAPPYDGTVHWYLDGTGWHAYRVSDMKPTRAPEPEKVKS